VPTRDELAAALTRFAGHIAQVASHFAKERQQIYRWARRHQLDAFRDGGNLDSPG